MSQPSDRSPISASSSGLPAWVSSGVLGIVIGAGGAVLALYEIQPKPAAATPTSNPGGPAPVMPAPGGGGPPMMGMGGGGGGGGAGAGGKRALTSLVGKLELLSRPDLKLNVELNAEQAKAIAAKLEEFNKSESMSAEEAQTNVEALEAILTPEQKEVLGAIGLPFGGGRGGRGGGGGGMMGGMGGGNPNENPFTQETNQKRLRDLLVRIASPPFETSEKPQ